MPLILDRKRLIILLNWIKNREIIIEDIPELTVEYSCLNIPKLDFDDIKKLCRINGIRVTRENLLELANEHGINVS